MNLNKHSLSTIFLILGLVSMAIGWAFDNTIFSYAAVAFIVLSLALGGRWLRPRGKK